MTIVTGDFNITRYPYAQNYLQKLGEADPKILNHMDAIDSEYEHLLKIMS